MVKSKASVVKIVIIGASTGFGAAMVSEGLVRNWEVCCITRSPKKVLTAHKDAKTLSASRIHPFNSQELGGVYDGADVVVFGLNVDYADWDPFMVDALGATIEALAVFKTQPILLFPGNIYVLGPQVGGPFSEDAPNNPSTQKGHLRNKMEGMLKSAADGGQPILLLRFADFFGPTVRNGLVDRIFGHAAVGKPIELVGSANTVHQMTYVPDAARIPYDLLNCNQQTGLTIVNAPTHTVSSLSAFADSITKSSGHSELKQKKLPWWMVKMFGILFRQFRELSELEYMFEEGVMLDDRSLKRKLPDFAVTPLNIAIQTTLQSYGCQHSSVVEMV